MEAEAEAVKEKLMEAEAKAKAKVKAEADAEAEAIKNCCFQTLYTVQIALFVVQPGSVVHWRTTEGLKPANALRSCCEICHKSLDW